ncbi:protein VTE6, chloroplastic [Abrus precatorius]|uniref:Protein VTE6, chloroplastic n=1 Tax=Abrus precatorius TaxID=3816 RepID=A0A8B8KEN0_ABRPR|nr:protein VTE6, chloroplastic [Abrus precatorius]
MESARWSSLLSLSHSPSHSRTPSLYKFMAFSTLHTFTPPSLSFSSSSLHFFPFQPTPSSLSSKPTTAIFNPRLPRNMHATHSLRDAVGGAMALVQSSPATWQSALLSNVLIFLLGSPILVTGLSLSGIVAAFLLGTLTWRAFGSSGFLLVATYFIIGTAATKVKMAQKVAQGVAEKRRGRRGPGSVIGSSAAGCVCAFLTIFGVGGETFSQLWRLGFVASFCTKLSDTVSSEIGKAYGKTTYLVTTLKVVPRGTEGAVSVEGTLAGILASIVLAFVGFLIGEVSSHEAIICVLASQIANLGESIIGAALQEKEGFKWLNNDAVNIINISMGSIIAVLMQQALQIWHS